MTRPRGSHIKVFVTPEERTKIESKAQAANLSLSAYLRALALNHKIRSVMDIEMVMDLAKVNGKLAYLASFLKDQPVEGAEENIRECRELQTVIHEIMGRVVR